MTDTRLLSVDEYLVFIQSRPDEERWQSFSKCARAMVKNFNYDRAADGILDAFARLNAKS